MAEVLARGAAPPAPEARSNGPKARMLLKEAGTMPCEGVTPSIAEVASDDSNGVRGAKPIIGPG